MDSRGVAVALAAGDGFERRSRRGDTIRAKRIKHDLSPQPLLNLIPSTSSESQARMLALARKFLLWDWVMLALTHRTIKIKIGFIPIILAF